MLLLELCAFQFLSMKLCGFCGDSLCKWMFTAVNQHSAVGTQDCLEAVLWLS